MSELRDDLKGSRGSIDGFSNLLDECRRSVAQESRTLADVPDSFGQETSAHSPGEGCLANTRRIGTALSNHRADCAVLRFADQRNPWVALDGLRFQEVALIQRSAVGKRLNKLKTECSQDEVPLERGFIVELKKWQAQCLESEGQWLFPSPATGRPLHADSIRADYLVPTGLQLGLGRIGLHSFRHTYRAWLDETGAPVGVQQKLMRHAHISTTMDQYGNASMEAKRKANRPLVQRLLKRTAGNEPVFIQ
jgi:integrase